MPASSAPARLRVFLGWLGGERRFVVRNEGGQPARDVELAVTSAEGRSAPIVEGEMRRKFPLEELRPDEEESVQAVVTPGTGLRFRAAVSWRDAAGERHSHTDYLSV